MVQFNSEEILEKLVPVFLGVRRLKVVVYEVYKIEGYKYGTLQETIPYVRDR